MLEDPRNPVLNNSVGVMCKKRMQVQVGRVEKVMMRGGWILEIWKMKKLAQIMTQSFIEFDDCIKWTYRKIENLSDL